MKNECYCFYLFLCVIYLNFDFLHGACSFPSDLTGNWISSEKETLNFTTDSLYAYPMDLTVAITTVDFDCFEQNDTLYILKSKETKPLFGYQFDVFLCLDLHRISKYKYWYQVAQDKEPQIGVRFYAAFAGTTVTQDMACTRSTPYEPVTFNTLVKEGAYEQGLIEATCPKVILHKFSTGTLTSSDGLTSCSNVSLDVCTERTQTRLTYDASCDASLTIASGGMSECLHYITDDTSGVTYLQVWNNDTTLATGVGRINCYALERNGTSVLGTLYPGVCDEAQTTTSVISPGVILTHTGITHTCQDVVESGSNIPYYVAIVLAAIVFILLIILLVYFIRKTKCRCCVKCFKRCYEKIRTNKNRVSQSDEHLGSASRSTSRSTGLTTVEEGVIDPYEGVISRGDKVAPMVFIAKKPIKLGPIIEPYLAPPAKVELLYEVTPRPTSSRRMFNRSMFFSHISLRHQD